MYTSYLYPVYRFPIYGYPVYGYPAYGGYANYGNNFVGSAVGYNNLINTGIAAGINQTANPINIG